MTVQELKDRLEQFDDDMEVRLMTQENYPFENSITGLCETRDLASELDECGCEEEDCPDCNPEKKKSVVFIVEGRQLGYGNSSAWGAAY